MLIEQRDHEDDHTQETQAPLHDGGGHVADQDPAGRAGRPLPVSAPAPRRPHPGLFAVPGGFSFPAPEVLAEEDAPDGAEQEPEEGPYPKKRAPDRGADDPADGAAGGAPVARAEPARPVGGGHEVEDKGDGGVETRKGDREGADVIEVRRERVDEPGDEDQGHAGEARQDAPGESRQHDDERNPEYRFVWRFHGLRDLKRRPAA